MRKRNNQNKFTGTYIEVKKNNIEFALKKFKNKVKDANIMLELRERQYYKKKSDKTKLRHKYRQQKEKSLY